MHLLIPCHYTNIQSSPSTSVPVSVFSIHSHPVYLSCLHQTFHVILIHFVQLSFALRQG